MEERKRKGKKRRSTDHMRVCVETSAKAISTANARSQPSTLYMRGFGRRLQTQMRWRRSGYFDKKLILDLFKNDGYDAGAQLPWGS